GGPARARADSRARTSPSIAGARVAIILLTVASSPGAERASRRPAPEDCHQALHGFSVLITEDLFRDSYDIKSCIIRRLTNMGVAVNIASRVRQAERLRLRAFHRKRQRCARAKPPGRRLQDLPQVAEVDQRVARGDEIKLRFLRSL